jgi:hypothetical protein
MRSRIRRIARRALLAALVLVGLVTAFVGVGLVVLDTDWGRDLIRVRVEQALSAKFPGARVAKLEGTIFSGLVVRDIELETERGRVRVGQLRVHVALTSLLHRIVRVDQLQLDDVDVELSAAEPAPAPAQSTPAAASSTAGWTIEVPAFEVHRGRLRRGAVDVEAIELAGSAHLVGDRELATVMTARGTWHDHPIAAALVASYLDEVANVPLLTIDAGEGARVAVVGVTVRDAGRTLEGSVSVRVPAEVALAFAGVKLPGDLTLAFGARSGGYGELDASLGDRRVRALARVDVAARVTRGVFVVEDPRFGLGVIAGDVAPDRVHGIVSAELEGASLVGSVDVTPTGGWVMLGAKHPDGHGSAYLELTRAHDAWTIKRGRLAARARELGGVRGDISAELRVSGRAWPDPELSLDGGVDIANAIAGALAAQHVQIALDGWRQVPAHTRGNARIAVTGATRDGVPLGDASLDLVASVPAGAPATIELASHRVALADGTTWSGTGARVELDASRDHVALRGFKSTAGTSARPAAPPNGASVALDASITRSTGDFSTKLDVAALPLALVRPRATGSLFASLSIARRAGRWSGTGAGHVRGVVVRDQIVDGDGDLAVAGSRVTLHARGTSPAVTASIAFDAVGPRDITDAAAWRALDRRALREASVAIEHLDLATVGGSGSVAGELAIGANEASGTLTARGVHTARGDVVASLSLAPTAGHDIAASFAATLQDLPHVSGVAQLGLPQRIFDPAAWQALGAAALRGANARLDDFAFDHDTLGRLGVVAPYRGHATLSLDVGAGATSASAQLRLRGFEGGALAKPVDFAAKVDVDTRGVDFAVSAQAHGKPLVAFTGRSPLAPREVVDLAAVRRAPVEGSIEIPQLSARELFALFDRTDVTGGTVSGHVDVTGTLGTPIAHATLAAHDIVVPAGVAGRAPSKLSELALDATWGGAAGQLRVTGREDSGGTLALIASGGPSAPASVRVALDAKHFNLAPLAAFAPGTLVAASGVLDASIEVIGVDPNTGDTHGELHLRDARIPLSSQVGTLHRGNLDVTIARHVVSAKASAKLGAGDIKATASVALAGATPSTADFDLTLRKVASIAAVEPVVTADVHGHFARAIATNGPAWTGDVTISHGLITIPSTERAPLFATGAPSDMTFADAPPPIAKPPPRVAPGNPWLVTHIKLGPTEIDAENLRDVGNGHIVLVGKLTTTIGPDGVAYDGEIDHQSGDIEVLGRAYQFDHASIVFDGGLDPELNVRIMHDFPDVTLVADIHGRASAPDLALSSDPNVYTEGQLLGFFLGGEPGGDPSSASRDAATGAGASVLSTKLGAKLKKVLPVRIDVLTYEAATSSSSGAIRAGVWLGRKLFVQYRGHPEARPDENANELGFEYYLPHNWFLQWTAGDRQVDAADLLHRWRW